MFSNEKDAMHPYFSKSDDERAIVAIDIDVENIKNLAENIPIYNSFEEIPKRVSSIIVYSSKRVDESILIKDREVSYIFIGKETFIAPNDKNYISFCVLDNKSFQSIIEGICTSEESDTMNLSPLYFTSNEVTFRYLFDLDRNDWKKLKSLFDFKYIKKDESLWIHQRSIFDGDYIDTFDIDIENDLSIYYSWINKKDENMIRLIGVKH